jgi:hypothetical protein
MKLRNGEFVFGQGEMIHADIAVTGLRQFFDCQLQQ